MSDYITPSLTIACPVTATLLDVTLKIERALFYYGFAGGGNSYAIAFEFSSKLSSGSIVSLEASNTLGFNIRNSSNSTISGFATSGTLGNGIGSGVLLIGNSGLPASEPTNIVITSRNPTTTTNQNIAINTTPVTITKQQFSTTVITEGFEKWFDFSTGWNVRFDSIIRLDSITGSISELSQWSTLRVLGGNLNVRVEIRDSGGIGIQEVIIVFNEGLVTRIDNSEFNLGLFSSEPFSIAVTGLRFGSSGSFSSSVSSAFNLYTYNI